MTVTRRHLHPRPPEPDPTPVDLAYSAGVAAYLEGIPAHWNPARRPTPEGIAWANGWQAAQHDRMLGVQRQRTELKRRRATVRRICCAPASAFVSDAGSTAPREDGDPPPDSEGGEDA